MATIDPNIAMGYKPINIENPMNQYAAMSQIQNAQNQNALAQYQLSAAQRTDEAQNVQNQLYAKHYNPQTGEVNKAGLFADLSKNPNAAGLIPKLQAQFTELEQKANLNKKTALEASGLDFKQRVEKMNKAVTDIINLNTPKDALASIDKHLASGDIDQDKANQLKQSIAQTPNFRDWQKNTAMGILDVKQKFEVEHQNRVAATGEKNANTAAFSASTQAKSVANAANPVLQASLAEAKAVGDYFGKNKAAAIVALPGAIASAERTINLIDEMVGKAPVKDKNGKVIQEGTKPRAGFDQYVGFTLLPGQRFIEGSDAASFELRQKQIEGKAFLEAFETLKGGGSITEKEGEKGTAAIMRMNKASSREEYISAARELQDVLRIGVANKSARAGVPVSGGGGGGSSNTNIDNLVNKYSQ
jgi:hypothetical protein